LTSYLLDTHVWSWGLLSTILPPKISSLLDAADTRQISTMSLYEIRQKVRLGKWPEMEPHATRLQEMLALQGVSLVEPSAGIADLAGALD
jgi:PIN domain nuclease of toxin-antitoxin system